MQSLRWQKARVSAPDPWIGSGSGPEGRSLISWAIWTASSGMTCFQPASSA